MFTLRSTTLTAQSTGELVLFWRNRLSYTPKVYSKTNDFPKTTILFFPPSLLVSLPPSFLPSFLCHDVPFPLLLTTVPLVLQNSSQQPFRSKLSYCKLVSKLFRLHDFTSEHPSESVTPKRVSGIPLSFGLNAYPCHFSNLTGLPFFPSGAVYSSFSSTTHPF